jgi:hypothetical protein
MRHTTAHALGFVLVASLNAVCSATGFNDPVGIVVLLSNLDTLGFEISISGFKLAPQLSTLELPELVPIIRSVDCA